MVADLCRYNQDTGLQLPGGVPTPWDGGEERCLQCRNVPGVAPVGRDLETTRCSHTVSQGVWRDASELV